MINKMKTRENLTKKRWLVLLASCVINLCIGALYAWSVFAAPMAAHITQASGRELTASDLAVVFSVGNGLGFLTMISGGFFNQKIGPRLVIFTGGVLFGFGFVICAMASSVAMLVGPMIVSFVFQQTGDYRNAFLIALVFAAAGLCLSFAYRKMLPKGRQDVFI